jgi:hypothetical protein
VISGRLTEGEKALALLRSAKRRDGLNPREFLINLAEVVESEAWQQVPGGPVSFGEFITRAGLTVDALEAAMKIPVEQEAVSAAEHRRYEQIRRRVRELLTAPGPRRGEVGRGRDRSRNTGSTDHGGTASGLLRRLRRDRPDLAARVDAGELSAHAAAVEAGFRRPTRTVPIHTPEAAVRALLRVFSRDDLRRALRVVNKERTTS